MSIKQIQELVEELNKYRHEYYNLDKPSISDSAYDHQIDKLKLLEKQTGYILSNSPTSTVGFAVKSKLDKVTHLYPLLSLEKTKLIEDVNEWIEHMFAVQMWKIDGLTVELEYDGGQLIRGATRGDGYVGEDITHNVRVFKNIPLAIPYTGKLKLAGEAFIYKKDFDLINSKLSVGEQPYKTQRNLVAGSVRQVDSEICASRNVHFLAFNLMEGEVFNSKHSQLDWLKELGFGVVDYEIAFKGGDIEGSMLRLKDSAEEQGLPIDGIVLAFNNLEYAASLGETSHHPLHSLAFKFQDDVHETVMIGKEWKTSRTGRINPKAVFNTVNIDGADVSKASLHNVTNIKDLCINIGCRILVSKRNMIIPHIEESLDKDMGILEIPSECPTCKSPTEIRVYETAEFLYCTNECCPARVLDKFVHFVKRDCMNIDGLSKAGINDLLESGVISTFTDLYFLEIHKTSIIGLEGWGQDKYSKLLASVENSKKVKCSNLIYALGIPNIGPSSSKTLAKHFNNDFVSFLQACRRKLNFRVLDDFGDVLNGSLHDWYHKSGERELWEGLIDILEIQKEDTVITSSSSLLFGKKVYATGTFANFKKEQIRAALESVGAIFAAGYSKSLDFLIVGSKKSSGKEQSAKNDKVSIMTEDELLRILSS